MKCMPPVLGLKVKLCAQFVRDVAVVVVFTKTIVLENIVMLITLARKCSGRLPPCPRPLCDARAVLSCPLIKTTYAFVIERNCASVSHGLK